MMSSRGYESEQENLANIFTYVFFFLLSVLYYLSFNSNPYKWFLPATFLLWIILGFNFAFAPRIFVQGLPVSLLLILLYGDKKLYKNSFFIGLVLVSFILAYLDHPFIIYNKGWSIMWN